MGTRRGGFCHLQLAWSLAGFQPRLGVYFLQLKSNRCYQALVQMFSPSRASAKPYFVPGDPKPPTPAPGPLHTQAGVLKLWILCS